MRHFGNKRSNLTRTYVSIMGYVCSHPECNSGLEAEGHHIIPLSKGGPDKFWNLICLCQKCHRHRGLHHTDDGQTALFTWKCMQESEVLGFYLDENEPEFRENLKKALIRKW